MQKHLYENAVAYYREHGKRIKKKKSKLPTMPLRPVVVAPTVTSGISNSGAVSSPRPAQPLNPMGWSVRYEFKMGVFAEFRQDLDTAERHYEGAYQSLVDIFHSAIAAAGGVYAPGGGGVGGGAGMDVLQPFTSRWYEARTLADCISLKVCSTFILNITLLIYTFF